MTLNKSNVVKIIFALLYCLCGQCVASDSPLGKTVFQAVKILGTDLESGSMIIEPPAMARGFEFRLQDGVEVQIFIERGQVPLTFQAGDNLTLYKELEVKGVRRVDASGKISCEGSEIVWFYNCPKPKSSSLKALTEPEKF
jgi:hypothetical protein